VTTRLLGLGSVSCECCVFSGRVIFDGLIDCPFNSHRLCVDVCVCVSVFVCVIECDDVQLKPLQLQ